MLRLAVLTTGRQDWGLLRPLCEDLFADPTFQLNIWAGGMACAPSYSKVVEEVATLGLPLAERLEWGVDAPAAHQAGDALRAIGQALEKNRPDALILLGDRFETCAAAMASTLACIPIVHLYGGEETAGAFDDAFRHAISKLSHLHFVAHSAYARRLEAIGENPACIHVVGLLSLDLVARYPLPEKAALEKELDITLDSPIGLVTLHPTTWGGDPEKELNALEGAMRRFPATWIVSLPNADPGGQRIREYWRDAAGRIPRLHCFHALGEIRYWGLMKVADFVLGNSSSGLTEAPFFCVPTINLGDRQKGRLRSPSVLDVPFLSAAILEALRRATGSAFKESLQGMEPAYGRGDASRRIIKVLREWIPPNPPAKPIVFS